MRWTSHGTGVTGTSDSITDDAWNCRLRIVDGRYLTVRRTTGGISDVCRFGVSKRGDGLANPGYPDESGRSVPRFKTAREGFDAVKERLGGQIGEVGVDHFKPIQKFLESDVRFQSS